MPFEPETNTRGNGSLLLSSLGESFGLFDVAVPVANAEEVSLLPLLPPLVVA